MQSNAIFGGLLAIPVLYLFLKDRRATAVIGLTIPLSIVQDHNCPLDLRAPWSTLGGRWLTLS